MLKFIIEEIPVVIGAVVVGVIGLAVMGAIIAIPIKAMIWVLNL